MDVLYLGSASDLRELVLSGHCIAFVGAGLSHPPAHMWWELVDKIAQGCHVLPAQGGSDDRRGLWKEVIDQCIEKDEEACNRILKEEFPQHTATARTAMTYVYQLPFRALFTTNFDPWVWQLRNREHYQELHVYPDLPLYNGQSSHVYYLHGRFMSEDLNASVRQLVFGQRSFDEAYGRSLLPGLLLHAFVYGNVLFIGFDPTEICVASLLRHSIGIRGAIEASQPGMRHSLGRRYALWPEPEGLEPAEQAIQDERIRQICSLEVTPVLYNREANDYSGLERGLANWVEKRDLQQRKDPFPTGFGVASERPTGEKQT